MTCIEAEAAIVADYPKSPNQQKQMTTMCIDDDIVKLDNSLTDC